MRRDGWLYALAFLAILAVGGFLIVPRLRPHGSGPHEEGWSGSRDEPGVVPPEAPPEVEEAAGAGAYPWVTVTVSGEGRPLRGPLRPVHGAEVVAETPREARVQTLRLRPTGPSVSLGAAGHQWVQVPARELVEGSRVQLPDAARPLILRVREPDGRPAPDVPVLVRPAPPGEPPRTDEGGTLVLDHLPRGLAVVDLATDERSGPRLRLHAGEVSDVRLHLDPAWTVRGLVRDAKGRPVAGARVAAFGPAGALGRVVHTQADGSFAWRGPATTRMALRVRAAGWGEQSREVAPPAVAPLETEVGEVRLAQAGVALDGVVEAAFLDPDAHALIEPAVAAIVREVFGEGQVLDAPRRAPLGADGRFRFHDLPADLPVRISVRGAGVPVDLIVQGRPGEDLPVVLQPPRGQVLAGTLAHPDGAPAAGVTLLVSAEPRDGDRPAPGDLVAVSGPDGAFRLRGLLGRVYYLRAYAPGRRSLLRRVVLPLEAPLRLAFEGALTDEERRVVGRVVDLRKRGLAGVTVRAAGVSARTDEKGRFRLDGVESLAPAVVLAYGYEPGPLPAGVRDPGGFAAGTETIRPGAEPLTLVLPRAAGLRFRALDAIDDRPLAFVHAVLREEGGALLVDRGIAANDGWIELGGLPARGVNLTLVTHDRRLVRTAIQLGPGETLDLGPLRLVHGMRVRGRVTDATGKPLEGARVSAIGPGWQNVGQDPGAERELLFRQTVTGGDGRFVLEGFDRLAPVDLAVWARGHAPTAVRVSLPAGSETIESSAEVKLVPGAYLALDLRETGGPEAPGPRIRGALVELEYARDGSDLLDLLHRGVLGGLLGSTEELRDASQQLLPEERGLDAYVLGPLRPGPYDLWVVRPGYERLRRRLTVIDPRETVLIDVMRGKERKFGGRVTRLMFEMDPE